MAMMRGWYTQVYFDEAEFASMTAPRKRNVGNVLRKYGMFNKWVYQVHAMKVLEKFKATSKTSCWEVAWRESPGMTTKSGIPRRMFEVLGMTPDPTIGVVHLSASSRVIDARALALELNLGLGAHGGMIHTYPIKNMTHHWMLVKVVDQDPLSEFFRTARISDDRNGHTYTYSGELFVDPNVGIDQLSTQRAEMILENLGVVEIDSRSNFAPQKSVTIEQISQKLAEISRLLEKKLQK